MSEKTLLEKALYLIEYISVHGCEQGLHATSVSDIYKFVHIARGKCNNPHEGWVKQLETTYQAVTENKPELLEKLEKFEEEN